MNKVVELVNEWASFENNNQDKSLEDFCQYYLKKKEREKAAKTAIITNSNAILIKLINRINLAFNQYLRCALNETELEHLEGFPFLNSLQYLGESKKTEVINYNLTELSTGIDILNRLIKKGLVSERQDPDDKRSKLIKITEKGESLLTICLGKVDIAAKILLGELTEAEKSTCISILRETEDKHTRLAIESKGKCLTELSERAKRN